MAEQELEKETKGERCGSGSDSTVVALNVFRIQDKYGRGPFKPGFTIK